MDGPRKLKIHQKRKRKKKEKDCFYLLDIFDYLLDNVFFMTRPHMRDLAAIRQAFDIEFRAASFLFRQKSHKPINTIQNHKNHKKNIYLLMN